MKKVFEFREDRSHPPPYPFAPRSLTTPTQRCWYCGGGQVPGYGGGWEIERKDVDSVCVWGGFGNGKVIKQCHLKVALLDDEAVPSFGAELSRRLISSSIWIGLSSPSQKVPLRVTFVGAHSDSRPAHHFFASGDFAMAVPRGSESRSRLNGPNEPFKRLSCTQRRVSNSTDTQTYIQKEVELWT